MRLHLAFTILFAGTGVFGESAPFLTRLPGLTPVFEENRGQAARHVLFLARDGRGTLAITRDGARVALVKRERHKEPVVAVADLRFPGADWTRVRGVSKLASHTNLLIGEKRGEWAQKVTHYAGVRVEGAYPGIDIVFHARRGVVEFDFELAPGADVARAKFKFPGRTPKLLPDGSLRVATAAGDLALPKPIAFQDGDRLIDSRFELIGGEARFAIGPYDRSKKLTIDPALAYLTYLGGSNSETPAAMAVDAAGNIYLAGSTGSPNFPVTNGALQGTAGGQLDAFVSKFSPAGVLLYSTLIGGRDRDLINDIAVDGQGSVYFCGATASTNFPLANAIQSTNKGGETGLDAMFGKLNPAGTALVYSTYYGGNYNENARACVVDPDGNLYVTGDSVSENFPFTPGAFQTSNRSPFAGNGFVTKIAPAGDKAVFSTYLGGGSDDILFDIAIDKSRNIYVAGTSVSSNYPVVGAYQPTNRGNQDAVLTKLNADGSRIVFSTFLGGPGIEAAFGVDVDGGDNVFVVGVTGSGTFPTTANALKKDLQGPTDVFITKFDASGATLHASTLFGGNREDEPFRTAVDRNGSLYVAGSTGSSGIEPVDAVQALIGGGRDAFLLKVSPAVDRVQMFTYLGGTSDDLGLTMALDGGGRVMLAGASVSTNLPTTGNAAQKVHGGSTDGFLAIIDSSTAANPFTVSTTRLTFTGAAGAAVARQQFMIRATTGAPEWTIDATTATGGTWLSATPRTGSGNGTIDVTASTASLAAGNYEGTLTVNNTRLGSRTVIAVILTVGSAGGTVPENGVVSAATFSGGAVAPGLLVTIFGSGLGPTALTTAQVTSQGALASTLAETRVLFDGTAASLVYVSAGQLSAIVPYGVAGKATTSLQVEYRGVRTNAVSLRVTETAPGLFTANSSGKGPGAILNADNSLNTSSNAAPVGGIIILYGTGEGITDPGGQDGLLATSVYPKPRQPVTVRIGGKDAEVLYAGAAPGLVAGVFQINVKVPDELSPGPQPVVVQIGTASSSPDVTVAVQP
ncbi:MAG: SBBP repeat-containing protein [Bryobacteraceae bacterium]